MLLRRAQRPRVTSTAGLLALAGALASGCAQNAIFELYVEVPTDGTRVTQGTRSGAVHFVRARAFAGTSIDGDWENIPPSSVRALSAEPGAHYLPLALVGAGEVDLPVNVRVELCETSDCSAPVGIWEIRGPARTLRLGRRTCRVEPLEPFRTMSGVTLLEAPTEIDRCDVAGCVNSEQPNYCDGAAHYCDRGEGVVCDVLFERVADRLIAGR